MNTTLLFVAQAVVMAVGIVGSVKGLWSRFEFDVLWSIVNAIGLAWAIGINDTFGIVFDGLLLTISVLDAYKHRNDDDFKKKRKRLRRRVLVKVVPRGRRLVVESSW